jgi:hypothetical protein
MLLSPPYRAILTLGQLTSELAGSVPETGQQDEAQMN